MAALESACMQKKPKSPSSSGARPKPPPTKTPTSGVASLNVQVPPTEGRRTKPTPFGELEEDSDPRSEPAVDRRSDGDARDKDDQED